MQEYSNACLSKVIDTPVAGLVSARDLWCILHALKSVSNHLGIQ